MQASIDTRPPPCPPPAGGGGLGWGTRLLGAVVLLALTGCGKPQVYAEVEGKVTLNGQPLPGVHVWFYPEADGNEQPPYATGLTDSQGAYTLTAATGKRGALVGKNRVVVNRPPGGRSDNPNPPPGPPIPVAYTQVMDTPLIVEVQPGPKQTINVDLPKW